MVSKLRERAILESVRQYYADFPAGDAREGESPDFVIGSGPTAIGVEVAEYFRGQSAQGVLREGGSPLKVHEEQGERVGLLAKHLYERAGARPLHVNFTWVHAGRRLNTLEERRVAEEWAALVARYAPNEPHRSGAVPARGELSRHYNAGHMASADTALRRRGMVSH